MDRDELMFRLGFLAAKGFEFYINSIPVSAISKEIFSEEVDRAWENHKKTNQIYGPVIGAFQGMIGKF